MSTVGEMLVALGLSTGPFMAGLAKAKGELAGFAAEADTSGKKASKSFNAVGTAGLALAGGVVAIGAASVDMAAKFQGSTTQIANNLNETAAQQAAMGQAIITASLGTSSSANTMAEALAPVAGELQRVAGGALSAAQAEQQLAAAQNLHEAANVDLGVSLKAITDLELVYHQGTAQAATDANLLFQAQSQLGIGTDTLAGLMQRLQPKLAGSNMGLREVLGTVRMLEPVVGTGTRAITTVGVVLQGIVTPSLTARKALQGLGVSLTDATGKFIGMPAALDAIKAAYDKLPVSVAKGSKEITRATLLYDLFAKQGAVGALLLKGGAAGIEANAKALDKNGTAAQAAERNSKTLSDQMETLKATVATAATAIGTALLPAISQLTSAIMPVVNSVAQWIAANPQLTTVILAVVGAVGLLAAGGLVLGPILAGIGAAIGIITSPITLVIGAVLGLAAHFGLFGKGAKDAVDGVVGKITSAFPALKPIFDAVGSAIDWISTNVVPALDAAFSWITTTALPALGAAFQWISTNVLPVLGAAFQWIVDNILPPVESVLNTISTVILPALGDAFNGVVSWVQANLPAMGAVFDAVAGTIGKAAGLIGDVVRTAFDVVAQVVAAVSPVLVKIGDVIFPAIGAAASVMLPILKGVFDAIGTAIDILHKAFDQFGAFFGPLWDKITTVVKAAGAAIMAVIGPIIDGMKWVLDNASNILFTKNAGTLNNLTPGGTGTAPTIPKISNIVGGINQGGSKTSLPAIPVYQTGGIVPGSGPQLAIVHGGETIIPPGALEPKGGVTSQASASGAATAAASRVSALASHIRLQAAQNAVAAAQQRLVTVINEHLTKTRTAADRAAQVATAHERLRMAEERLTLVEDQLTASAAKSLASGSATGTRGAGAGVTGNQGLTAALVAFTTALREAVASGVALTIDYQTVGSMLDQGQYANASRVSSGFVTGGSPAG